MGCAKGVLGTKAWVPVPALESQKGRGPFWVLAVTVRWRLRAR